MTAFRNLSLPVVTLVRAVMQYVRRGSYTGLFAGSPTVLTLTGIHQLLRFRRLHVVKTAKITHVLNVDDLV